MLTVRSYRESDYQRLVELYSDESLYGGQFDDNRDSEQRLVTQTASFQEAVLVAENESRIVGSVSLIDDGRVAWLYRFAVERQSNEQQIATALYDEARRVFAQRGHRQLLVYTPVGNEHLLGRYRSLGLIEGGSYTCFWTNID